MPELVSVPNLDGVPNVLFAPGYAAGLALATADDPTALAAFASTAGLQRWGLYDGLQPVIEADTVIAFDHKREWVISDFPLEKGAFESYDKVQIPFDIRLIYVAGGSEANRAALLASVDAIASDLNVYDVVMPEKTFSNLNVIHYDFRRSAQNGVGLLSVALWCQEVRETTSSASSNPSATGGTGETAAPSGADPVNGGTVQATDATASQTQMAGTQDFTGGYNVSGYDVNAPAPTGDVGELVATDPQTGKVLGTVPGSSALPVTSSTISGLPPAGPDTFTSLNVGTDGLS